MIVIYFQRIGISIVGKTILIDCHRTTNCSVKAPSEKSSVAGEGCFDAGSFPKSPDTRVKKPLV